MVLRTRNSANLIFAGQCLRVVSSLFGFRGHCLCMLAHWRVTLCHRAALSNSVHVRPCSCGCRLL
jgi:hypothetical protein